MMNNNNNNKIKKVICRNWLNENCRFSKEKCNFAHGKDDIIKKKCFNDGYCWNEDCIYKHPEEWNPYNNKKECSICIKGYCNKENKKYKHINENNENEKEYEKSEKKNRNKDYTNSNNYESNFPKLLTNNVESISEKGEQNINIQDIPINITFNIKNDDNENNGIEENIEPKIKKINEEKILNEIKNQKMLDNFNKCINAEFNFEKVLNTCEYNMNLMNLCLNKYVDIIKNNFDNCIEYSNDINFVNFCNNSNIRLIDINNNVLSLKEQFIEYKKFLLKLENRKFIKENKEEENII